MSDHLTPTTSDRGLDRLPPVPGIFAGHPHGHVRIYESSNAEDACIWLKVQTEQIGSLGPSESTVQLTLDAAQQLSDQIDWLIEHHYQRSQSTEGDPR